MKTISKIGNLFRAYENKRFFKNFSRVHPDVMEGYNIEGGFSRIYHIHVRKTGGTSVNQSFLSLGGEDPQAVYNRLGTSPRHHVKSGARYFVGWDNVAIESGAYFFGFSHHPVHRLRLPSGTFTVTCLRDPVRRVLSHFRMLKKYREVGHNKPDHLYAGEIGLVGGSFRDYLEKIPARHLFNQIYMFSKNLSADEAAENASACHAILWTQNLDRDIKALSGALKMDLETLHIGKTPDAPVAEEDLERLREKLAPEYRFLEVLAAARPDFSGGHRSGD